MTMAEARAAKARTNATWVMLSIEINGEGWKDRDVQTNMKVNKNNVESGGEKNKRNKT